MESSTEVLHGTLDSTKPVLQICQQIIRLLTPSASTEETNPTMPLESETINEQNEVVEKEGLNLQSSTEKAELVCASQSLNASVQQLLSGMKECNIRILENKVAHNTLLNNLNLPDMSSKDLVDTFESLFVSKNKILAEKVDENQQLLVIKEALKKISGRLINSSFADKELTVAFEKLSSFLQSIRDEQTVQKSLLVEIKELSYTISNKLHVKSLDS